MVFVSWDKLDLLLKRNTLILYSLFPSGVYELIITEYDVLPMHNKKV